MATEKQDSKEQTMESDIKKPKEKSSKPKRLAPGWGKPTESGYLPAKDSLEGV